MENPRWWKLALPNFKNHTQLKLLLHSVLIKKKVGGKAQEKSEKLRNHF